MSGITGFFATIIGYPVQWIYSLINNYGITIIIVTVIVRLCLIPLYAKQMKNSAKMAAMQSKQKEIQARYANDRVKMNEEMQALYQEEGINTMSGCLPLLIQLPIIWGLFALLRNPLQYMTSTNMIAAVHESFLWVTDLSQPDSWLLPIIAGVTTYLTSLLGMSMGGNQGQASGIVRSAIVSQRRMSPFVRTVSATPAIAHSNTAPKASHAPGARQPLRRRNCPISTGRHLPMASIIA